jgi:hypothetical protein
MSNIARNAAFLTYVNAIAFLCGIAAGSSLGQNFSPHALPPTFTKYTGTISSPRFISAATPATEHLRQTLESIADFQFTDASLDMVADHLRRRFEINVVVDAVGLGENGSTPSDIEVTVDSRRSKVANMLDQIAQSVDVGVAIRNDALVFTSKSQAEKSLSVRVYDVTDLVQVQERNCRYTRDFDTLMDLIVSIIAPDSWDDVGGEASMQGFPSGNRGLLVISQTYAVHQQVEDFLNTSRKVLNLPAADGESLSLRAANAAARETNKSRRRMSILGIPPLVHE